MPKCPNCGTRVHAEDTFCNECGADLDAGARNRTDPVRSNDPTPQGGERDERRRGDRRRERPRSPEGRNPRPTGREQGYTTGRKAAMGGGAIAAVGAFLPWITVSFLGTSISRSGIDADGVLTLAGAAIVLVVTFVTWSGKARVLSAVLGVGIAGLGLLYIVDPLAGARGSLTQQQLQVVQSAVSPGIGLYLTAVGGVAIVAGVARDYSAGRDGKTFNER